MGLKQSKIFVRIVYKNRKINQIELYDMKTFKDARVILNKYINFPFIYLDVDNDEIDSEHESLITLIDILDVKNLYIKKKVKSRKILGEKYRLH